MKYSFVFLWLVAGTCAAAQMTGFGAKYYDDITEVYSDNHETDKDLVPVIAIGTTEYKFEVNTLASIAKNAGVKVNKDNLASWICLKSGGINYWFISDNEMGAGDLTAVAIAKDGSPCTPYKGVLQVSVKAPVLTTKEETEKYFKHKPKKDIVMYYKDIEKSGEYTQSNSIMYYLKGDKVQGVIISQGTTN
ncbi:MULTISPECIES: hypothetical protein [Cronobacter]|nr:MULTISPECIES: hypothetical protein [Cronobacter]EKK3984413.1 hypothetical protein [Cronobacter sakazakii]ELY2552115.1 hypothetical protein [Cronobacter sakazakii]ELY6003483.1 hypothetical protein [Cronobacter sakazakii]ELY6403217.1 hypothetical protein [Cronobacter sakazakii]MBF4814400.1 hypothetical protein [Cronobacter sakazakii]